MKKFVFVGGGFALLLSMLCGAFFAGPLLVSAHNTTSAGKTAVTARLTCQQYLQTLARYLNVSVNTLEHDKGAVQQNVLQMVKDGKLTQSQADLLQQRLQDNQLCSDANKNQAEHGLLSTSLQKYQSVLFTQVAQGLHLSSAQLQADMQKGMSLEKIAKAQHISKSHLSTLFMTAAQNTLSQAQKAGDITQQQADVIVKEMQRHPRTLDRWLNSTFKKQNM